MPAKRVQKLLFKSIDVVDVGFSSLHVDDWCDDLRAFEADCMHDMRMQKDRAQGEARALSPDTNVRARGTRQQDVAGLFAADGYDREFSITISALKQHVPLAWYHALIAFLQKYGTKGAISLERGNKDEHLHIQVMDTAMVCRARARARRAWMLMRASILLDPCWQAVASMKFGEHSIDELVKAIKAAIGTYRGDPFRCSLCTKELVQGQTFQRMLGYVFKDEGKSHFRNTLFGDITRADVDAGKEEWSSLKLDYMQSKVALNKSNIFTRMHAFCEMVPETQEMSFADTIALAINSGKYMIAANMFCAQGGMMRADSAEAYWRIIHGERATGHLVSKILYMKEFSTRYFNQRVDHDGPMYRVQRNPDQELGEFVPLGDGVGVEERRSPTPRSPSSSMSSSSSSRASTKDDKHMTGYEKIKNTIKKFRKKKNKFVIQEAECEDDEESGEEAGSGSDEPGDDFVVSDHESVPEDSDEGDM